MTDTPAEFITVREIAALAECYEQNIYFHLREGNLPAIKVAGTRFIIRRADALRLVAEIKAGKVRR
jgi:excisionase family DNA binding protein